MSSLVCMAKGCSEITGYTLGHPLGGEVTLCESHYAKVKQAKERAILEVLDIAEKVSA
jgi:hypothetical protein